MLSRRRRLACLVFFLFLASLFFPLAASAQEAPVPPAAYYGRVYLNGEPAPAGTTVAAKIENQGRGELSVVEAGYYGGAGVLEPKLVVRGTAAEEGKLVSFLLRYQVAGKELVAEAKEKVPFTVGAVQSLNLSADPMPVAVASDPLDGATNIPVDKAIIVTFSEKVGPGASYEQIALRDATGASASITKKIEGGVLTLTPSATLAYSTKYTVTIPAGAVQDLTGNALAQEYTFSFTTQAPLVTPPGGGGAPPVTPTIPEQPPAGEKVEKPVQPGTTTVAEVPAAVRVEVPAGAVTGTDPVVKAEVVSEAKAASAGIPVISRVVDVTIVNGTLTGEVTITLYFDRSKLSKDQEPVAHYYDEQAGKWVPVEGMVDLDKGTVTVKVSHLTTFTVFAVAKEAPKPEVPKPSRLVFVDMAGHWAEETVAELASRGIVSGYPIGMGVIAITNGAIDYGVGMLLFASLIISIWVLWKTSKKPLICPINGQKCGKHCAWYDPREEPHCWRVKYEEGEEDEEDWDEDDEEDWDDDEEDCEEEKPRRKRRYRRSCLDLEILGPRRQVPDLIKDPEILRPRKQVPDLIKVNRHKK